MGPMPRGSHEPRVHGSWGPELAGGSRSIPSSPVFVQRSRTAPRTPPSPGPTHLIPLPCGTCPPVTSPGDPAVPRCAHCCHRAQVSWVRDHLCSSGRQRLPTRFDLLPTGLWKDLPSPHSSETLHPWAQPFLHTSTDRGRTGRPPTLGGGSPHCVAREGTHPEFQKRPWHRWDEGATPVPPQLSPRPCCLWSRPRRAACGGRPPDWGRHLPWGLRALCRPEAFARCSLAGVQGAPFTLGWSQNCNFWREHRGQLGSSRKH